MAERAPLDEKGDLLELAEAWLELAIAKLEDEGVTSRSH
jgi:hypothetical protein